ncbi:hypothetical protein FRD01_12385 [Microvenator marinus]|uniref:Uncharacterized protein n=1 Tax=Microvenator marinus TaxID=2600177 RepID=A0A5B8XX62_9DELT|nr:hypothetical protein [Microvenator marinus]QED28019.1 hypothetical protein FRD01_12385 [Microvenator marinus]
MSKSKRYVKLGMGTAAIVGVVFVCASMWIHSDAGHAYISKRIQSYATEGMAGSLEIGSLYEIDFFQGLTGVRVLAGDVRFRAPDGRETIHVGDADATLDLAAFLGGTIAIREAVARLGTVTIEMGEGDKLTIEETFASPEGTDNKDGSDAKASDSAGLELRHLNAREMRVVLRPDSETTYTVNNARGSVFVTRPEGGEFVRTELVEVSGTFEEPKFLGDSFSFSKLDGRIAGNEKPMVEMTLELKLDEGTIDTRLGVEPGGDPPIKLHLSPRGDTEVKFLTGAAQVVTFFGSDVEIQTD